MRIVVMILLLVGAHFAGTAFVPGQRATVIWPFGIESRPVLARIGGLPSQSGSVASPLLAGLAVLAFVGAFMAVVGVVVPAAWFVPLVVAGSLGSIALFLLFAGPWAALPIVVDVILLWGVLGLHWTAPLLRGG